jgi:predicted Holliday junction resolvase-like endonuclease
MFETLVIGGIVVLAVLLVRVMHDIQGLGSRLVRMEEKLDHIDELSEIRTHLEEISDQALKERWDELTERFEERAAERRDGRPKRPQNDP